MIPGPIPIYRSPAGRPRALAAAGGYDPARITDPDTLEADVELALGRLALTVRVSDRPGVGQPAMVRGTGNVKGRAGTAWHRQAVALG